MNEPKHCLLIDDDLDDQEIFLICIAKISNNIECKIASSGVQALEILNAESNYIPDFIFLDVNMPKMNGIECLKSIRQIKRLDHSMIYMYSTTLENGVVQESKNLGADDFIVKPTKTSELREQLSKILGIGSEIQ